MKAGSVPAAKREWLIRREVWAHNVEAEFKLIRCLVKKYPYVSMDTEFPGVIHEPSKHHTAVTPSERYTSIKSNVDELHLIQVGLAFAPTPYSPPSVAFEINLREFDRSVHPHNPVSVDMLADHGLDFAKQRADGVEASVFRELLLSSGLVYPGPGSPVVTWATFHSAYDFGYLVKLLTGRMLPATLPEFLSLVRVFFGNEVYDVKHMKSRSAACAHLPGSLDDMAATLGLQREGTSHQAGSDSALTWDAFRHIRHRYLANEDLRRFAGVLHGLELDLDIAVAGYLAAAAGANGNGNMLANNRSNNRAVGGNGNGNRNWRKVALLPLR